MKNENLTNIFCIEYANAMTTANGKPSGTATTKMVIAMTTNYHKTKQKKLEQFFIKYEDNVLLEQFDLNL